MIKAWRTRRGRAILAAVKTPLLLYHALLMISGCSLIALLWGSGGAPCAIPRPVFFLFGVVSAMTQMFFSIILYFVFPTSIYLLCPLSFALLWFLGAGSKRNRKDLENARWEAEFIEAEQALHEGPENPAYHLRRAKLLDAAGLSPEALEAYRRAHQLSDKFFSEFELREVEDRLGAGGRLRLTAEKHSAPSRPIDWLPDLSTGWILCVLATAPVLLLDKRLFVGVLSVWLFVVWYNAAQND